MAKEPKSLNGRVVAITGAARGIGKATATALVRQGAKVAIGDVELELAQKTAAELGENVRAYELDVTKRPSVVAFLDAAESDLGPIDVMINNAGIMPVTPFAEESDASAAADRHQPARRDLRDQGSDEADGPAPHRPHREHRVDGRQGRDPDLATYCATKHAVIGLSEAVRGELRGTGVEVTLVMPAVVNTELTSGVTRRAGSRRSSRRTSPTRSSPRSRSRSSTSPCRSRPAVSMPLCGCCRGALARRLGGLSRSIGSWSTPIGVVVLSMRRGRRGRSRLPRSRPSASGSRSPSPQKGSPQSAGVRRGQICRSAVPAGLPLTSCRSVVCRSADPCRSADCGLRTKHFAPTPTNLIHRPSRPPNLAGPLNGVTMLHAAVILALAAFAIAAGALVRANRRVRASEQRYRQLVDALPKTIVSTFDRELRYTFVGGMGLDTLGWDEHEYIGRTPLEHCSRPRPPSSSWSTTAPSSRASRDRSSTRPSATATRTGWASSR